MFPLPRVEQRMALECLERVGLIDKAFERVDKLSGGQQQRVGIARALAQQPKIILADEPVASLDPGTANTILSLLLSICREDRIPVVLSLHQLEFAKTYADRIVALSRGRVVFDGRPDMLHGKLLGEIYRSGALAA
jgi:phosphonate transport system ATP-binding protein